jgi:hypothetical protein
MRRLLSGLVIALAITPCADAQDFRIVTTIKNLAGERPQEAGVYLTLFRQRKVYDYFDAMGEVIIYEPGANQFTILNVRRSMATTVHFDQIKKKLRDRKPQIERYVAELRRNNDPIADEVASAFDFQLRPTFQAAFDRKSKQLVLTSPKCQYRVKCADNLSQEQTNQYLAYADWMARLNSVLHPGAMFPEPRIDLNDKLRRYGQLPIRVELTSTLDGDLHLAAEHRVSFELENSDRSRITEWEAALTSPRITKTTFQRYQEMVLASNR